MMKKLLILLLVLSLAGLVQADFTWDGTSNLTTTETYDGTGVDSDLNPHSIGGTGNYFIGYEADATLNVDSGTLTWQSGNPNIGRHWGSSAINVASGATLNINNEGDWGSALGHGGATGTANVSGTLNWDLSGNNEQRIMFGNGINKWSERGTGNVNIDGGTFNITLDSSQTLSDDQRSVRVGTDDGVGTINVNSGTFEISAALPFALGAKWVNMNGTPSIEQNATTSTLNIDNGDFIASGSDMFAVGDDDVINFVGGSGSLSILNWTTSDFQSLASAGNLQVQGAAVSDLSQFDVVDGGSGAQGSITLIPEPATIALLGFGSMLCLRRRKRS